VYETPTLLAESAAMLSMRNKLNGIPPPDIGFWDPEGGSDTTPDMDMDMSLDMFTEAAEGDVDEEVRSISLLFSSNTRYLSQMSTALSKISALHSRKVLHLKRLLERAQASAAAQLHALQAEVRVLRSTSAQASLHFHHHATYVQGGEGGERCVCGGRRRRGYWSGYRDEDEGEEDGSEREEGEFGVRLVRALKGKGNDFSEKEVRRALRGLGREGRMRL
jgi:pyrimidine and pyridine-specific 5'-nucleotidase